MQKSVIIIGGGIAGLTAAHELLELNYNVTLIERNDIVGGLARTYQSNTCPYEYCWRGYGPCYSNTFEIMSRIKISTDKTVLDNLLKVNDIAILQHENTNKKGPFNKGFKLGNLSFSDYIKLVPTVIDFLLSSEDNKIKKILRYEL